MLASVPPRNVAGTAHELEVDTPTAAGKRVRSLTGQLLWDYGHGVCTLDAPQAQGATGFLGKAGAIDLSTLRIDCRNDYATVLAVSLDGQPLASAKRILVQVGTREQPTGWATRPIALQANGDLKQFQFPPDALYVTMR